MKLILEREQRSGGLIKKTQVFAVTFRAEISQVERDAINKYKLADDVLHTASISVAWSWGTGPSSTVCNPGLSAVSWAISRVPRRKLALPGKHRPAYVHI